MQSIHREAVRVLAVFACVACFGATPLARAGTHSNKEIGYSIFVPGEFEARENAEDDFGFALARSYYLLDSFRSKDELRISTRDGWNHTYRRQIFTYYFPTRTAADIAKMRADREKKAAEEKDKINLWFSLDRIHQSFEDFAKEEISGFFFSDEKATKVAGFDATVREMTFEKLQQVPQRWIACSYKVPGGEFAVVCTCTDEHFKKLKGEFSKVFATFKMHAETGLVARDPERMNSVKVEGDLRGKSAEEVRAMSPPDRDAHYKAVREKAFADYTAKLPEGVRTFESERFLVAFDTELKYAKDTSRHAEAVLGWLDERFGSISTMPVQSMILRLHAKETAPTFGITVSFGDPARVHEIDFQKPTSIGWTREYDSLSRELLESWFSSKNDDFWSRTPAWLRYGLTEYIDNAQLKGAKLVFPADEFERDRINEALAKHSQYRGPAGGEPLKSLKELFHSPADDMWSSDGWQYVQPQCASVVRYLVEGPGSKQERTKIALQHYLGHLGDLVAEVEARLAKVAEEERKGKENKDAMSEEDRLKAEDEAYKKKRENEYGKLERELVDKAFERTFAKWDDGDWKSLDQSWRNWAEKSQ